MVSLANDRNWLLNPSTMKKVQQCRRLIQMEFGVKLHLTEENLVDELVRFAAESRSDKLAKCWSELKDSVPELAKAITEAPAAATRGTYRGRPILDSEPVTDAASDDKDRQLRKTKVVYRGRVVD